MIWSCLYILGIVICENVLLNNKLKENGKITLCDFMLGSLLSSVWWALILALLINKADDIIIYTRKERNHDRKGV